MTDDVKPQLLPTVDPSKVFDPLSTIDSPPSYASTVDHASRDLADPSAAPSIPGYAITGELARGGMGVVFSAVDQTLEREVAVKTLLPGAPADRFVTESKITARLPHPGIPPVYALGRLDDGSPYLAMKLIRGRTLADLLKARSSPTEDLSKFIAIFEQIAQAVGFAHEHGIIHRDLKPLNVMVGTFGEVQVMDWGLAKDLSASREGERPEPTDTRDADDSRTTAGAIMGTPGYMAPEQARGEPADARADVFALGATLAAILTGVPAFVGTTARETIQKAARGELGETLDRLTASGADAELVDLAKDCLAADASARPADSKQVASRVADYRLGVEQRLKLAETAKAEALVREAEQSKRRRVMQWAAGIIAVVLLAGVIGTSIGWNEAKRQTGVAKFEAGEKGKALEQAEANLKQAERNLAFAKKGNEILGSVFEGLSPKKIAESKRPLQDLLLNNLGNAVKDLDESAIGDPLEAATMQNNLGKSLQALGDHVRAAAVFEKAHRVRASELGADHPETLAILSNLATTYMASGRWAEAIERSERVAKGMAAAMGEGHPAAVTCLHNLASNYRTAGRLKEAVPLFEKSLRLMKASTGTGDPDYLNCLNSLATAYDSIGRRNEAFALAKEALDLRKARLGADHPETIESATNLGAAWLGVGRFEEALPLLDENLKRSREKLGPRHPNTLSCMNFVAVAHRAKGNLNECRTIWEELAKIHAEEDGPDHPTTLMVRQNLAAAYLGVGRTNEAVSILTEVLKLRKAKFGADHPDSLTSLNNLGAVLLSAGRLQEAIPHFEEALKLRRTKFGDDHPDSLTGANNLAAAYLRANRPAQAVPLFEKALAGRKVKLGVDHPQTLITSANLAGALLKSGRADVAIPLHEDATKRLAAKLGADHPETLGCMNDLGMGYRAVGRLDLALPLLEETRRRRAAKLGADHPDSILSMSNLAAVYFDLRRVNDSLPLFEATLQWRANKLGSSHPSTVTAMTNLGVNLREVGRSKEAVAILEEACRVGTKTPGHRLAAFELRKTYAAAGDPAKAAKLLNESIKEARAASPADQAHLADLLHESGAAFSAKREWREADTALRECLAIRQKVQPDHWTTFNTQSFLGAALMGQKKYAEAEPLLLKGYEGLKAREKTIPPNGKTRIPEAIDRLVELYTVTNKPDEVKKWQAERAKYTAEAKAPATKANAKK